MPTTLRSRSKINLGLRIGPPRPDRFHALTTLYQTLALHDLVTVSATPSPTTDILLTSNHPRVPLDHANTAWRAVHLALSHLGRPATVAIHIEKRLPIQGGLGAGSANAAAALLALEAELLPHGIAPLPGPARLRLAAEVGSDVPLFLLGGAVLGGGRGELVTPLPDLAVHPIPCLIAIPTVGVSTPAAFRDWDIRTAQNHLTREEEGRRLEELSLAIASSFGNYAESAENAASRKKAFVEPGNSGILHLRSPERKQGSLPQGSTDREHLRENPLLSLVRTGISNDFEEVVFSQHPPLRDIKRLIAGDDSGSPALVAALSGSGSALFGLFRSATDARNAQQRVQHAGTVALLTETLPRGPYWSTMVARDTV